MNSLSGMSEIVTLMIASAIDSVRSVKTIAATAGGRLQDRRGIRQPGARRCIGKRELLARDWF